MITSQMNTTPAGRITVSGVFGSDMVLQRGEPIRVWGFADAAENGRKVFGEFMGMHAETCIDNGEWTLVFGAQPNACAEAGHSMRIYTDETTYVFENVLIGDVFMVIGQSNAAYSMADHRAAVQEAARGGIGYDDPSLPIRLHYNSLTQVTGIQRGTKEVCPQPCPGSVWRAPSPDAVSAFSALGYLFAASYARTVGVPVGMIEIDGNGQPIGAFMPNEAADMTGSDQWSEEKGYYVTSGCNGDAARYMYNHYMYPFEKYAIAGMVWYQGESDCAPGLAETFPLKFAELVRHMRTTHNLVKPDFPVYLIEFPSIYRKSEVSVIPEGQGWAFMDLGLVRGMLGSVVHRVPASYAVSSGDAWGDRTYWNSLHPNCKYEQASRAAAIAAAVAGMGRLEQACGPILQQASLSEDGTQVVLTYTNVGNGLQTADCTADVRGFRALHRQEDGKTLRVGSVPLPAHMTAPDQILLDLESRADGIAYHVIADEFYGDAINLTSSSGVPACADAWLFS